MSDADYVRDAYARGRIDFMGVELFVAPGALVPRPETELLARTALDALREMAAPSPRAIDLCCGAGNLACAIARHHPTVRVWATDLTPECVELARRNAQAQEAAERIAVHQGDLLDGLAGLGLEGTIDAVVCNPPYISDKRLEGERAELLDLEPREAFAAGPYGLAIHMRAVKEALTFLRPGGVLLFEVGAGQDRQVTILFERARAYEDITVFRNELGEGRVVAARRKT